MSSTVAMGLILVGVLFDLFGCIGLVRLPDVYNRVQAATKCVTLGTCMILAGTFLSVGVGQLGVKALMCAVFILLTSPVGAHAIARGAYLSGVKAWEGTVVDEYRPRAEEIWASNAGGEAHPEDTRAQGVSGDA